MPRLITEQVPHTLSCLKKRLIVFLIESSKFFTELDKITKKHHNDINITKKHHNDIND